MSKQLEAIYTKLREIENTQNLSHYGYALIQDVKSAVSELEAREANLHDAIAQEVRQECAMRRQLERCIMAAGDMSQVEARETEVLENNLELVRNIDRCKPNQNETSTEYCIRRAAMVERFLESRIAAAQNPYDKVLVAAMGDLNASDRCEWPNAKDHLAKIIQDTMGPRAYLEYLNPLPEAPKGKE